MRARAGGRVSAMEAADQAIAAAASATPRARKADDRI